MVDLVVDTHSYYLDWALFSIDCGKWFRQIYYTWGHEVFDSAHDLLTFLFAESLNEELITADDQIVDALVNVSLAESPDESAYDNFSTADRQHMFEQEMNHGTRWRRVFRTQLGVMGFGRNGMEEGDVVAVIPECSWPCILRQQDEHYVMVGNCYMENIMRGEVMTTKDELDEDLETIELR